MPAAGWRIDEAGVLSPRGRRTPWAEIDRFEQIDDENDRTHVYLVTRDGISVRIPGLDTNIAGLTRERAGQLEALNAIAAARRRPSELTFPVRLATSTLTRVGSTLAAVVLAALAVALLLVGVRDAARELPALGAVMVVAAVLCGGASVLMLHTGWRSATITMHEVVLRSPLWRRSIPLSDVIRFAHHTRWNDARTCRVLVRHHPPSKKRWSGFDLPGRDPDYRLPALDAYVQGLNGRRMTP